MRILILVILLISSVFGSKISVFKVEQMHCPLCTIAVKKAIKELDGIESVSVKLNLKKVKVIYNDKISIKDILKAIETTSYHAEEISTKEYKK